MKKNNFLQIFVFGFAMFSMFFGAGNIIYPLAVGEFAGAKNLFASVGLVLTAVAVPIAGVIGMIQYDGSIQHFFGRLGRIPGLVIALFIISLLGPLGSAPRCIVVAYSTFQSAFPQLSLTWFSAISCVVIFLLSMEKKKVLSLLGWVLTPLLLVSLASIIIMGLIKAPEAHNVEMTRLNLFFYGLKEGYNTMDLLAAFFFSSTILGALKQHRSPNLNPIGVALRASILAGVLLIIVYFGFSYLAAFHGGHLVFAGKEDMLKSIALKIAGPKMGILVCLTISLACLTTAIALLSAFTDFIQKEIFKGKVEYRLILALSLALTFVISTFEFSGISTFLSPILKYLYPILILLTITNVISKIRESKSISRGYS
ncbi:MAG: branched-chain amino acid transport system II carrier protein [Simkaniaceae bacterium]|nr:branched-chain amino acid transport system II carrier protein [Candidatus Sacchlamyda saccharinae]